MGGGGRLVYVLVFNLLHVPRVAKQALGLFELPPHTQSRYGGV